MSKPNGVIVWEGASSLDGAPIVLLAVGLRSASSNSKTGAMVQTYILRSDLSPVAAVRSGADASICGNCPARGNGDGTGRICYVQLQNAPTGIYKAYKRGSYPHMAGSEFNGAMVRLGAYGDPAAVPVAVWRRVIATATAYTGYTHQWRRKPSLKALCMASVDDEREALEARALGWRTFRASLPGQAERLASEAICPASAEAGRKLTCETCLACSGTGGGRRGSIVIRAHGGAAVMANISKLTVNA
jgi:hypothetical protein